MSPTELRRLAVELERAGKPDLAIQARNRAAARELGVRRVTDASPTPFRDLQERRA